MGYQWLTIEILVALAGLIVLILSLVFPGREKLAARVSVCFLVGILAYTIYSFPNQITLFKGIYLVDMYGSFFKILFLGAAILVLLMAASYNKRFIYRKGEFYSFFLFATLAMMVMASAGDLITLYLGLEMMTITFYILSAFLLNDRLSAEAGLKYLILGAISSAVLLFGMSLVYALSGTTIIAEIAAKISPEPALTAAVVLLIAGFAFKVSVVPFHMWAPDIYQGAPTPVTAFLAVGSKAAGFAALVRVMMTALPPDQINWSFILALIAGLTIIVGNLIALAQKNIKRLLAYSSIAQAGYILVGLVAANIYGLKGLLFYAMLYVFSNTGAFAVAAAVEVDQGSSDLKAFSGLARRSPMLAAIMTVCLLSLAGIPPLAGFVGKFYLFSGAIQAGYLWLAFLGLIMSMVSVYYYLNVARVMYTGNGPADGLTIELPTRVALWVCLAGTVFLGIYPSLLSRVTDLATSIFF